MIRYITIGLKELIMCIPKSGSGVTEKIHLGLANVYNFAHVDVGKIIYSVVSNTSNLNLCLLFLVLTPLLLLFISGYNSNQRLFNVCCGSGTSLNAYPFNPIKFP